jgi:hypothetical protein
MVASPQLFTLTTRQPGTFLLVAEGGPAHLVCSQAAVSATFPFQCTALDGQPDELFLLLQRGDPIAVYLQPYLAVIAPFILTCAELTNFTATDARGSRLLIVPSPPPPG